LNDRITGQGVLPDYNPKIRGCIERLYTRPVREKRIDRVPDLRKKGEHCDWQTVDRNSLQNKDVRELGGEWLCMQTLYRLQADRYLEVRGWSGRDRNLAPAHL
jgi:hypothetical protein